jgi:hypothetical protein
MGIKLIISIEQFLNSQHVRYPMCLDTDQIKHFYWASKKSPNPVLQKRSIFQNIELKSLK